MAIKITEELRSALPEADENGVFDVSVRAFENEDGMLEIISINGESVDYEGMDKDEKAPPEGESDELTDEDIELALGV